MAFKESDWNLEPDGEGNIQTPEEVKELFNSIGMQMRFVTISGKNEIAAVASMVKKAWEFFNKNPHLLAAAENEKVVVPAQEFLTPAIKEQIHNRFNRAGGLERGVDENSDRPATYQSEDVLTVENVLTQLSQVKDKTKPVYAFAEESGCVFAVVHVDTGISDRVDINFSRSVIHRGWFSRLSNCLGLIPEGSMYVLGDAEFLSNRGLDTIKGFGRKDGYEVVVLGENSYYPVSKMDKADCNVLFLETTLLQELESGSFEVIKIEDLK
jgi:hypothetical protein